MAEPEDFGVRDRAHIFIDAFRETAAYTFPARSQDRKPLRDDYNAHATALLDQLAVALGGIPEPRTDTRISVNGLKLGANVEIRTVPPAENSRTTRPSMKGRTASLSSGFVP